MIHEWRMAMAPARSPYGDPYTSRRTYMIAFCVLEGFFYMRLPDDALAALLAEGDLLADEELQRRKALG